MAQNDENKKIYNGWFKFYERGFVGIQDRDKKVLVAPSLGYTDIGELKNNVAIAKKNDKCGLIDTEGKQLCPFIYDRMVYIGEGCYKAGLLQRPNTELVVKYASTSHVYEILNAEGKILCSRDRGYNYVSEVCDGEVTVGVNGKCGIADLQGNILVPLKHKYIQPVGDALYLVSYDNSDNYWATIIDRNGNVMIPADKHYRDIHRFYGGVAVAYQDSKWGLIDKHGNHVVDFDFTFAEEWGEGYFKVERGAKKNIMRPDGSLVLKEWHHDVYKVTNGFFIFGNTIRKSKDNPKTRYIRGLAHVNGDIIFPMIFERTRWFEDNWAVYAEIGTKPYILTPFGSAYDPERGHLPKQITISQDDSGVHFEVDDNFPWKGIEGRVCEGCVFAGRIVGNGEGCERLTKQPFRERYIKGRCEHRKTDITELSEAEKRKKREDEKAKDTAEKQTDVFAVRLLKEFIDEMLGGDINKLVDFELSQVRDHSKYGDTNLWRVPIAQAVMALVFADAYPELSVHNMAQLKYRIDYVNTFQQLFGSNVMDQYFMGMEKFKPTPEQHQRAVKVAHLTGCIGNLWVMPNKFGVDFKRKYRDYFDKTLIAMYGCMTDSPRKDRVMQGTLYTSRKLMPDYQDKAGFNLFVERMMFDDFVDYYGVPQQIFMGVWSSMKGLETHTYFKAVDEFCTFVESFVRNRGERMVKKLKQVLREN